MTTDKLIEEAAKRFDEEFPEKVAAFRHVGKLYGTKFVSEGVESTVIIDREKAKAFLEKELSTIASKSAEKIDDIDLMLAMVQSVTEDTPHSEIVEMIKNIRKLYTLKQHTTEEANHD